MSTSFTCVATLIFERSAICTAQPAPAPEPWLVPSLVVEPPVASPYAAPFLAFTATTLPEAGAVTVRFAACAFASESAWLAESSADFALFRPSFAVCTSP